MAVVGQFKAGKSSLLNALIEREVLPVRAVPATSVITVVAHGPSTGAVVRYRSGDARIVGTDELDRYVAEQQNPGNRRGGRAGVYPVLVGGGIPFCPQRERRVDLELVGTRTFRSRVVYLRYRVAR